MTPLHLDFLPTYFLGFSPGGAHHHIIIEKAPHRSHIQRHKCLYPSKHLHPTISLVFKSGESTTTQYIEAALLSNTPIFLDPFMAHTFRIYQGALNIVNLSGIFLRQDPLKEKMFVVILVNFMAAQQQN